MACGYILTNIVYNHLSLLFKFFSIFSPTVLWFRTEMIIIKILDMFLNPLNKVIIGEPREYEHES